MNNARFDVTAIGNAIVDVLAKADDALLVRHNLPKGGMSLIDAETAERLYAVMGPGLEASGGSAATTPRAAVISFPSTRGPPRLAVDAPIRAAETAVD